MIATIFSEKGLLLGITLLGMAICAAGGIGQVAARGDWAHPLAIAGYVIGAAILVIVGAALFNVDLPLIDSPRAALIAVILLAVVKVVLTQIYRATA